MIHITPTLSLNETELKFTFIRAPGPGGQNVNKVASAVQLRFNVMSAVTLPETVRTRLLALMGKRISAQGDLIIKASRYRTQERNKQDALERLVLLLRNAATPPKRRKATKPTFSSKQRRLSTKKRHAVNKSLRQTKPHQDD